MTKEAIIAEIKKLTPEEQREIAEMLWEPTEEDHVLTEEDIAVAEAREKHAEEHPETVMSHEEFNARVRSLTGR